MVSTKTIHIINNVIIFLLFIYTIIVIFQSLFIYAAIVSLGGILGNGEDINIVELIFESPTLIIGLLMFIISTLIIFIWPIYFILSYYRANIENKHFRISGWINISYVLLILLSNLLLAIPSQNVPNIIISFIYVTFTITSFLMLPISFVIFLIGYYKNKLNK